MLPQIAENWKTGKINISEDSRRIVDLSKFSKRTLSKKYNIKAGIHCPDGKTVKERFEMGYDLGTISADAALLTQASKREIADAKK